MKIVLLMRALIVAFTVGSVLLVINQSGSLFGPEPVRVVPAILTYCVPFVVFLAGTLSNSDS